MVAASKQKPFHTLPKRAQAKEQGRKPADSQTHGGFAERDPDAGVITGGAIATEVNQAPRNTMADDRNLLS